MERGGSLSKGIESTSWAELKKKANEIKEHTRRKKLTCSLISIFDIFDEMLVCEVPV